MKLLAQTNLAWMRYPLDDQRMAPMRDEIDRINRLGDASPGCVWRFETPDGDAPTVRVLDAPRILFNLPLWRSIDDLRHYVYRTEHADFFRRRREWFILPPQPPVAMWWVAESERPSVSDAMERLERLWRKGPSPEAFSLADAWDPDGRPVSWTRRSPRTNG